MGKIAKNQLNFLGGGDLSIYTIKWNFFLFLAININHKEQINDKFLKIEAFLDKKDDVQDELNNLYQKSIPEIQEKFKKSELIH